MSWDAIYSLKDLDLDPSLLQVLSSNKQEISGFIVGDLALSNGLEQQVLRGSADAECLVRICHTVYRAGHALIIEELRFLFHGLMVGDMQRALFGPMVSLSKIHEQEIRQVLDRPSQALLRRDSIPVVIDIQDLP